METVEEYLGRASHLNAAEAEEELLPVLRRLLAAQGWDLKPAVRAEPQATDYVGTALPNGSQVGRIGVEYKHYAPERKAGSAAVHQVVALATRSSLDRVLLISRSGFTAEALDLARQAYPVEVELRTLAGLRDIAASIDGEPTRAGASEIVAIIREMSAEAARIVARNPMELDYLEWRDIERMMTVVLQGLGFDAELTPASKDGGKDIILRLRTSAGVRSYIVELKHWRSRKTVGGGAVRAFVEVVARERHVAGVFLSTYGYAKDVYSSLTQVERSQVRLGDQRKIVSLCRTYVRSGSQLWRPGEPEDLAELLLADAGGATPGQQLTTRTGQAANARPGVVP